MYKVGDLIIYGGTGVCRIDEITNHSPTETLKDRLFYILSPLYQNCKIFAPTDNVKIIMRPVIAQDEAEQLIDMIPTIQAEPYSNSSTNQLIEHYKQWMKSYKCLDLLELCMSIYEKRKIAKQQNRKLGYVDENYMKRAEDLLFGELAVALEIDKQDVPDYIENRIS